MSFGISQLLRESDRLRRLAQTLAREERRTLEARMLGAGGGAAQPTEYREVYTYIRTDCDPRELGKLEADALRQVREYVARQLQRAEAHAFLTASLPGVWPSPGRGEAAPSVRPPILAPPDPRLPMWRKGR